MLSVAKHLCYNQSFYDEQLSVLAGLNWQVCLVYLDDLIVVGKMFENMIQNLDMVLQKMKDAGLKLKPRKCHLFGKEVEFLGHVITKYGIKIDP